MPNTIFFKHISDHPSDRETGWSENLQGVTHDEENWFITQQTGVWKINVGIDLNDTDEADPESGILNVPIPPGLKTYDHLGDPDYFNGHLFVPVEKTDGSKTARIACFDAESLEFIDSALLTEQEEKAPWCAVNPADGLLYSSRFDDVTELNAYEFTIGLNRFKITLHHKVSLIDRAKEMTLSGIQGGVFSFENGENHLYLSSNDDDSRGVHVFQWPEGIRIQTIPIDDDFWTVGEEIEGLTYWDLDGGQAPGIRGQLHVLELDNDVFESDDVKAFKHYKIIRFPFVANNNPRCREVHRADCRFINLMKTEHKVGYRSLTKAIKDGYDGCHFCIGGKLDKR